MERTQAPQPNHVEVVTVSRDQPLSVPEYILSICHMSETIGGTPSTDYDHRDVTRQ
jgi:hypothetical protein